MKQYLILTALAFLLAAPAAALSQSAPSSGGPATGAPPTSGSGQGGGWQNHNGGQGQQGGQGGEQREERLAEHKAEIIHRMNEHIEEIEKRKACVEAAKDHEALRACMPQGGQGGGGQGGGGQGQQGGGGRGGPPSGGEPQ